MVLQRWRPRSMRTWSPFEDIEDFFGSWDWPSRWMQLRRPLEGMAWTPKMDVYEKPDAYTVMAELPGVNMKDIEVSMSDNTLNIKGERIAPEDVSEEEYQRCEVCYGEFQRSIRFSDAVKSEGVEAIMDNGVLMIRVPKTESAEQKKIPITVKSA